MCDGTTLWLLAPLSGMVPKYIDMIFDEHLWSSSQVWWFFFYYFFFVYILTYLLFSFELTLTFS